MREQNRAEGRQETSPRRSHSRDLQPWGSWEPAAEFVWQTKERLPLPELSELRDGLLLEPNQNLEELVFYDFETTGLSGGAGTVIFLAGFASYRAGELEMSRYLLTDYPGEGEFLRRISGHLSPSKTYVSYNGKSFDQKLLQSRLIIHAVPGGMPRQLDLLYPARRLWRDVLDSCSLQQVERGVLGVVRSEDIPGALIPQVYQSFVRGEEYGAMQRVDRHHVQDIVTLARLLAFFENLPSRTELLGYPQELAGLGALLLRAGDPRGEEVLHEALSRGEPRAGRPLLLHYKRTRDYRRLESVLREILEAGVDYLAIVEMAKLLEHRQGDYAAALETIDLLLEGGTELSPSRRRAIEHRRRRLAGKLKGDCKTVDGSQLLSSSFSSCSRTIR